MLAQKILNADKEIQNFKLHYNDDLIEFEAAERHVKDGGFNAFPLLSEDLSPLPIDLDKNAAKLIQKFFRLL